MLIYGYRGKKCLVIDKREHVGGNIYTENVEGIQQSRAMENSKRGEINVRRKIQTQIRTLR